MRTYRPITLLTDFGQDDPFVGIIKGVIWGILPQAPIVDLCHNLPSYDIAEAAFLIHLSYSFFPPQSVHLVVVDPGVGSARRPLLVTTESHYFIAPDNGVLSYIFEKGGLRRVFEIKASHYFLSPPSSTFHARDIFAPVAAYLCKGIEVEAFGSEIDDFVRISLPWPRLIGKGVLAGEVLHTDHFGNLITNICQSDLAQLTSQREGIEPILKLGSLEIRGIRSFYGEGKKGRLEAVIGSFGYLEVFAYQGNAGRISGKKRGDEVIVILP